MRLTFRVAGVVVFAAVLAGASVQAFSPQPQGHESRQQQPQQPPSAPNVKVGDRVEAWITAEWMPATLVRIGGGPFSDSPYLVEYGTPIRGIQPIRWLSADYIRPLSAAPPVQPAAGPRLGRYQMLSYGNPSNPIRIGHIMLLAGEKYEFYSAGGELLGTGRWVFLASEQEVVWHSGLLQEQGWGGSFEVRREGKTHQITLVRGTIATNSID